VNRLYAALRPILFRLDPERAHNLALRFLWLWGILPATQALSRPRLPAGVDLSVQVFGLRFANPLGLAAGFDKQGIALRGLAKLGFGHIEAGTVTPLPQPGNPRPRIFRLEQEQALINRMGFPNAGGEALAARLRRGKPAGVILGVNLGKGAQTPLEEAARDYRELLRTFCPLADYCAINISSPNTLGLRRLQSRQYLDDLLDQLMEERSRLMEENGRRVPLLVKLSPDLQPDELRAAVEACLEHGVDGVIATNTTRNREGVGGPLALQAGGLSGRPLFARALQMVRAIHEQAGEKLPIIGVGGIMSGEDARRMRRAGATLVQIYTGLIYRGPGLIGEILGALAEDEGGG
jgi:dihydroorotate dehydrogenase